MNLAEQAVDAPLRLSDEVQATATGAHILGPVHRAAIAFTYGLLMFFSYRELSYFWAYLGFTYRPPSAGLVAVLITFSALPAMLLPARPRTLAEFSAWLLYFAVFLPGMIIPPLQGTATTGRSAQLFAFMFVSSCGYFAVSRWRPKRGFGLPRIGSRAFWLAVAAIYVMLHGLIFFMFRDAISFAGFDEVYEQRDEAASLMTSTVIVYVLANVAGAINPFLIATGIAERNWWRAAAGVAGQVLVYTTLAGKVVLFSIILIAGAFLLFGRDGRMRPNRMGYALVAIAVIGVPLITTFPPSEGVLGSLTSLIYMRTLYLPGVLIGIHSDFFSLFPLTYMSHSTIGRLFVEYPYGNLALGQVIGDYVTPSAGYEFNNYNANFIATDGIASFGLIGIPLMTAVMLLVVRTIDRLLWSIDLRVRCAAFMPFLAVLANTSLFSSLVTGGGVVLTAIMWLWAASQQSERGERNRSPLPADY